MCGAAWATCSCRLPPATRTLQQTSSGGDRVVQRTGSASVDGSVPDVATLFTAVVHADVWQVLVDNPDDMPRELRDEPCAAVGRPDAAALHTLGVPRLRFRSVLRSGFRGAVVVCEEVLPAAAADYVIVLVRLRLRVCSCSLVGRRSCQCLLTWQRSAGPGSFELTRR